MLGEPEWDHALEAAGAVVVDASGINREPVDAAVTTTAHLDAALRLGAPTILVTARAPRRRLLRAGYSVERLLVRRGPQGPRLVVPVGRFGLARTVLVHRSAPLTRLRRVRNELVAAAVRAGFAPFGSTITVATRGRAVPWLIAGALGERAPRYPRWCLELGDGDELQRGVFHVAPRRGPPDLVVKFSRVPGYDEPFERDARGLALIAAANESVARRAPRLVERATVSGLPLSVETAGRGRPLVAVLQGRAGTSRRRHRIIEEIAAWILETGEATAVPAAELAEERRRLEQDILPPWHDAGAPPDLVARVPPVPGVLAHHDLGCWNIVTNRAGFTVLDWESARLPAFPLWDLLYFLTDALVAQLGPATNDEATRKALALLRGETPASSTLFAWVHRGARSLGITADAIGPIATLAWLHHGRSHVDRDHDVIGIGGAPSGRLGPLARIARAWLVDAALGPSWPAVHPKSG